ncbi:MAG TPA: MFS transporter [Chloroflexota bacterium]|nr:MFS transporter [Chloroflexota bacterium]
MTSRRVIAYLGASFAVGVFHAFNSFTLPLWLAGFTPSYLVLGLLGNTRSFEGALVSPLVGWWSDRTWLGWLGRRRPFILVGGLVSALVLGLTPVLSRLPVPPVAAPLPAAAQVLLWPAAAIFAFTFLFNTMDDVHKALLADITTPAERNRLSAWSVVVLMWGQVTILVLGYVLWPTAVGDAAFLAAAGLMGLGVLLTVGGVREPPPTVWRQARAVLAAPAEPWRDGRGPYRAAAVLCLVAFAYWSGVNAVLPLVSVYLRDILGASVGEAQLLPALLLLATTLCALPAGWLGTRYGKRRVLALGYAIMGVAALLGLVVTTKGQGALVFLLAGVGNATSTVLTIPLLADLVPRQRMGMASGVLAASGSVAAPLASVVAGALADAFGPRAIFALMAAMVLLALGLLPGTWTPPPATLPQASWPPPAADSGAPDIP